MFPELRGVRSGVEGKYIGFEISQFEQKIRVPEYFSERFSSLEFSSYQSSSFVGHSDEKLAVVGWVAITVPLPYLVV